MLHRSVDDVPTTIGHPLDVKMRKTSVTIAT